MPCAFRKTIPTVRPFKGRTDTIVRMTVNCGKCLYCQSLVKKAWIFRFQQEARVTPPETQNMITLTYKDSDFMPIWPQNYDHDNPPKRKSPALKRAIHAQNRQKELLYYRDVGAMIKHFRKDGWSKDSCRFFYVGEYGSTTFRPHYHLLTWGIDPQVVYDYWYARYGQPHIAPSVYSRYAYVVNYLDKDEYPEIMKDNPLFTGKPQGRRMSPGIGSSYLDEMTTGEIDQVLKTGQHFVSLDDGRQLPLPVYFRNKIYEKFDLPEEIRDRNTADILTNATQQASEQQLEILYKLGLTPKYYQIHLMKENERKRKKHKKVRREYGEA